MRIRISSYVYNLRLSSFQYSWNGNICSVLFLFCYRWSTSFYFIFYSLCSQFFRQLYYILRIQHFIASLDDTRIDCFCVFQYSNQVHDYTNEPILFRTFHPKLMLLDFLFLVGCPLWIMEISITVQDTSTVLIKQEKQIMMVKTSTRGSFIRTGVSTIITKIPIKSNRFMTSCIYMHLLLFCLPQTF